VIVSFSVQKYAVPFESRPPRLLQEKEAVEAGLLLCVDNKTRNQLINHKTIKFSLTAKRIAEMNRKYSFVLLISRKQCCGSGSIQRIHMFLGLLDPDPHPFVTKQK
jgi:hypothetical protein